MWMTGKSLPDQPARRPLWALARELIFEPLPGDQSPIQRLDRTEHAEQREICAHLERVRLLEPPVPLEEAPMFI